MLSPRVIDNLKARARESSGRIKDLFEKAAISVENRAHGWGQFLDEERDNTQFGIYGTSAGIQVLVLQGYPKDNPLVSGSSRLLEEALTDENSRFKKKGDACDVYKLVFLADAQKPDVDEIVDEEIPAMEKLIEARVSGLGWGEYCASTSEKDPVPKLVSTAMCLRSLRRYQRFVSGRDCRESVEWLCRRVLENGTLRAHQLGLAGLSLACYSGLAGNWNKYNSALSSCTEGLLNWTASRKETAIGELEIYNYSRIIDGQRSNGYLFFLPDCLAAIFFLKQRVTTPEAQDYVARVVRYFSSEISRKGGFIAGSTSKKSTVDHLWLHRLMHEFSVNSLEPRRLLRAIRKGTKLLFGGLFLVSGVSGLYLTYAYGKGFVGYIVGSVLSVVGLGLFYTLLGEWLKGGRRAGP